MTDRTFDTIVFAGGGSGGHLFPGLAVAEEIASLRAGMEIVFAGSQRTVESAVFADRRFDRVSLSAPPSTMLKRNPVRFAWRYWRSRKQAAKLLRERRPLVVVGLGGFASVPVVSAAAAMKIPVVLLEQNVVAGRANRWLSRRATLVCHSFDESIPSMSRAKQHCVTGNPVRRSIIALNRFRIPDPIQTPVTGNSEKPTLLILGGSQGAVALNEAFLRAVPFLIEQLSHWRIVHQTGVRDVERVRCAYAATEIEHVVSAFFADLDERYATADVVLARAGATTLAELACVGIPPVLLPLPNSINDHQWKNACCYERAGGAAVVRQASESSETAARLTAELQLLLADTGIRRERATAMRQLARPDAARDVADRILDLCPKGRRFPLSGLRAESGAHCSPTRQF
ncbi:MAG: undecaprenyldiphospho-muramoylpentapeptide beta-N-acetylglucosaminyltransferase [Planctomycetes bacterium]|nr:undecaprenyldiphospho-muramoylpentapeptide beta-N-acetylglucosaminyltransferase [Planctomycetota bacterium]